MKLSIKERIELLRHLRGFNTDKTSEMELVKGIYDKAEIPAEKRKQLEIIEESDAYHIGLEQNEEIDFNKAEIEFLKKFNQLVESRSRINLNNLSLFIKIRDCKLEMTECKA
jgi:hypothetical protein